MGERKVLNRYVPPDFDPSIIPKFKRDKNKPVEVRMMLPFSMRCTTCGEYMGRGKKFNSRKEDCKGEDYMGIRRFRFIVKCSVCSAEISFKTDPKNSDYECEYGATRNFEMWKENEAVLEEDSKTRELEEEADAMKSLENRTLESKIEMDVLDALDEIKSINQRHERVDTAALLDQRARREAEEAAKRRGLTVEDEAAIKSIKFNSQKRKATLDSDSDSEAVKEKDTSKPIDIRDAITKQLSARDTSKPAGPAVTIVKKKRKTSATSKAEKESSSDINSKPSAQPKESGAAKQGGLSDLMGYGDSSDDNE
mmetsp:Transcript_23861/g.35003  ORF Transcript_23861/g.35003 Transcript_23861/m.35003 type:complete len:310 (+) Transcript_23861:30-959(+)